MVQSGQTVPVEIRTSEVMGVPSLIPVMRRTSGDSPCLAQSGTHPLAASAPSTNTTPFALIALLHDRILDLESLAHMDQPLSLMMRGVMNRSSSLFVLVTNRLRNR